MVAVDLAISKETDSFHPHKQTRLYGITTALSQCPQGNSRVLLRLGEMLVTLDRMCSPVHPGY